MIKKEISQSDCIKLGFGIEKILKDIILIKNKNLVDIKPINKKGKKEIDHLFKDEINKIIYYSELKSNLNLDTEKSKITIEKCLYIFNELKEEYKDYDIKMFLIGLRYFDKNIIPKNIINKFVIIKENILGINDYLDILNINYKFENEEEYIEFINYIIDIMFNKS